MGRRFEDLWATAADDGASCPIGVSDRAPGREDRELSPQSDELDLILEAWSRERARRIEATLLVEEARRVISRFVAEGTSTPMALQRARRVLGAIRALQAADA